MHAMQYRKNAVSKLHHVSSPEAAARQSGTEVFSMALFCPREA